MGIISRELKTGGKLIRGTEELTIERVEKIGRSTTAHVLNSKGKKEKLSITDLWNQKVKIKDPVKTVPSIVSKKDLKITSQAKPSDIVNKKPLNITSKKVGAGIASWNTDNKGAKINSSWVRTH